MCEDEGVRWVMVTPGHWVREERPAPQKPQEVVRLLVVEERQPERQEPQKGVYRLVVEEPRSAPQKLLGRYMPSPQEPGRWVLVPEGAADRAARHEEEEKRPNVPAQVAPRPQGIEPVKVRLAQPAQECRHAWSLVGVVRDAAQNLAGVRVVCERCGQEEVLAMPDGACPAKEERA